MGIFVQYSAVRKGKALMGYKQREGMGRGRHKISIGVVAIGCSIPVTRRIITSATLILMHCSKRPDIEEQMRWPFYNLSRFCILLRCFKQEDPFKTVTFVNLLAGVNLVLLLNCAIWNGLKFLVVFGQIR